MCIISILILRSCTTAKGKRFATVINLKMFHSLKMMNQPRMLFLLGNNGGISLK